MKASAGSPPKRAGSVSIGMIRSNSTIEPGQPWESSSGSGAGPTPGSWMKWTSMPPTGAVNCRHWFRRASCTRQS